MQFHNSPKTSSMPSFNFDKAALSLTSELVNVAHTNKPVPLLTKPTTNKLIASQIGAIPNKNKLKPQKPTRHKRKPTRPNRSKTRNTLPTRVRYYDSAEEALSVFS